MVLASFPCGYAGDIVLASFPCGYVGDVVIASFLCGYVGVVVLDSFPYSYVGDIDFSKFSVLASFPCVYVGSVVLPSFPCGYADVVVLATSSCGYASGVILASFPCGKIIRGYNDLITNAQALGYDSPLVFPSFRPQECLKQIPLTDTSALNCLKRLYIYLGKILGGLRRRPQQIASLQYKR